MLLKSFRYLLFPFSFIYGAVLHFRNWMFNKNYIKSASFNFPLICIGNLAVGGTGKTPMAEYLIRILKDRYQTATLSRGYKRMTKGFAVADEASTALEIGDEPMQLHRKFPDITVAVGEERLVAIPFLLQHKPEIEVIILDDAFQHRSVRAGLNIVLTDYKNLYTRDFILPAGDLRDNKSSIKRAEIIIVTKCKPDLTQKEKGSLIKEIKPAPEQSIFFTTINYVEPYHLFRKTSIQFTEESEILLLCGIANPKPLKEYMTNHFLTYNLLRFNDHHIFNMDDLEEIKYYFNRINSTNKFILTTEKDAVRLEKFEKELIDFPIYVLPIRHEFLFGESALFEEKIIQFVDRFRRD